MQLPAFVCLFVCLLVTSHKNTDRIIVKILTEMDMEELVKF